MAPPQKRRRAIKKRKPTGGGLTGSIKAFDMTEPAEQAWYDGAYADGFRLYALLTTQFSSNVPRPDAQTLIQRALNAGLKVGAYSRNPLWWPNGLAACGPLLSQIQFFAIDIETDPGIPATRAMADGIAAQGVRPILYSGYGMWPSIMGSSTAFSDLPLWDTNAGGANSLNYHTYTPNILSPTPHLYGGWNTPSNMRVGVQQTFETVMTYGGFSHNVDLNSWDASFLI